MKRLFENLFYRTYLIALTNNDNTHHLDSAIMLFCIFQALNVCGVLFWSDYLNYAIHIGKYSLYGGGVIWNGVNFFYFYKHFERIKANYINETKKQRQAGFLIWWIYIFLTIVFIAVPMYFMKK